MSDDRIMSRLEQFLRTPGGKRRLFEGEVTQYSSNLTYVPAGALGNPSMVKLFDTIGVEDVTTEPVILTLSMPPQFSAPAGVNPFGSNNPPIPSIIGQGQRLMVPAPQIGLHARIRWGQQRTPFEAFVDFERGVALRLNGSYFSVDAFNENPNPAAVWAELSPGASASGTPRYTKLVTLNGQPINCSENFLTADVESDRIIIPNYAQKVMLYALPVNRSTAAQVFSISFYNPNDPYVGNGAPGQSTPPGLLGQYLVNSELTAPVEMAIPGDATQMTVIPTSNSVGNIRVVFTLALS